MLCKAFPLSLFYVVRVWCVLVCFFFFSVYPVWGFSDLLMSLVWCLFIVLINSCPLSLQIVLLIPTPPPSPPSAFSYARTFQYCPVAFGFSVLFFVLFFFFLLCALVWSFSLSYLYVQWFTGCVESGSEPMADFSIPNLISSIFHLTPFW